MMNRPEDRQAGEEIMVTPEMNKAGVTVDNWRDSVIDDMIRNGSLMREEADLYTAEVIKAGADVLEMWDPYYETPHEKAIEIYRAMAAACSRLRPKT